MVEVFPARMSTTSPLKSRCNGPDRVGRSFETTHVIHEHTTGGGTHAFQLQENVTVIPTPEHSVEGVERARLGTGAITGTVYSQQKGHGSIFAYRNIGNREGFRA